MKWTYFFSIAIFYLESGQIRHENYDNYETLTWPINSDCEKVRIKSVKFNTEKCCDKVTIGDKKYSGNSIINYIGSSNFTIYFKSDGGITDTGFVINWNCTNT